MRSFKLFWGWTKNPSSSLAQGFSSPLLYPKIFPSYLPHHIFCSLHLESSIELPSLSRTKFCNTRLEKGGELNVAGTWRVEGMWRGKGKKSASSQMQKQEKRGKLPPFFAFFFLLCFFLFFSAWEEEDTIVFFFNISVSYLPPPLSPTSLLPTSPLVFLCATVATMKTATTTIYCRLLL